MHQNVSVDDMNEGKIEYAKFGKVGLNNCVSSPHHNILQRVHQWGVFSYEYNIWMLLLPVTCSFTCARVGNSTQIQNGLFHSSLLVWM